MLSKITVNSPWYALPLCLLIGFVVAYWLYANVRKKQELSKPVLFSLVTLRFVSIVLTCILLLGIFLKYFKNETENPIVIVAVDNSSSMVSGPDSAFVNGQFWQKIELLKRKIGKKYDVKTILFGSNSIASNAPPTFKEKETDLGQLIVDVENNYSNQNVGALILASDGIYNKGSNPVYTAEKTRFPIYTIAFGDTTIEKDVSIQKVDHNQVAYLGNNFPVEVAVQSKKYSGNEITVSLFQNGTLKAKQIITLNSDNALSLATFTLSADKPGVVRYDVRVTVNESERNLLNNTRGFVIEVIDNKEKILLLANAPHPDVLAIREAISNVSNYELENSFVSDFKGTVKPYSLIMLHGSVNNQIINECKANHVPFWIINPQSTDNLAGVKINSSFNRFNETEPYLTTSFGLFTLSSELKKFVNEFPALRTFFGNYIPLNSANILISQKIGEVETENPVLLFTETNGLKCATFIGDGLWKWKFRDFAEHKNNDLFNELIGKSIQYLAVKADKSLFRLNAKKIISENEAFELDAEVYNKSYELITEPDVNFTLTNANNKKFNYAFSKISNSYKLNVGLLPPGDYRYLATVKNNTELLSRAGTLSVKEVVAEKINTVANHHVLFQLSQLTNGKLFYPGNMDDLSVQLLENDEIKAVTFSHNTNLPLIDQKWLFYIILLIYAAEWTLRKRFLHI